MQLIQMKNVWPICTLPIIWIFTEGDEIKSRLPFKNFSTLSICMKTFKYLKELFFQFCSFPTKYLHILWPHQGLSTMIVLILNINVQTELVVRLLMENLVVAHTKVRKFHREIVGSSILQKKNFHNFCPSTFKMVN